MFFIIVAYSITKFFMDDYVPLIGTKKLRGDFNNLRGKNTTLASLGPPNTYHHLKAFVNYFLLLEANFFC